MWLLLEVFVEDLLGFGLGINLMRGSEGIFLLGVGLLVFSAGIG